ncbi:hypothetical protein TNCV_2559421 [Trichonephila clavipes]|nr:hypothetical protein TNCV_2559421 [Trichonephila clavipes]
MVDSNSVCALRACRMMRQSCQLLGCKECLEPSHRVPDLSLAHWLQQLLTLKHPCQVNMWHVKNILNIHLALVLSAKLNRGNIWHLTRAGIEQLRQNLAAVAANRWRHQRNNSHNWGLAMSSKA